MGAEKMNNEIVMYDGETKDSPSVFEVLDGVAKAPYMITQGEKDKYVDLIRIVSPANEIKSDEEPKLVKTLEELSAAVHKLHPVFHGVLLTNIFALSMWNYGLDARNALMDLITNLAASPDNFLEGCLHLLVSNFLPPLRWQESMRHSELQSRKKEVHCQLHMVLQSIADLVPLAPMKLRGMIARRMPMRSESKEEMFAYVEGVLGLENKKIGEFLRSTLLAMVVNLITELDVDISWEDIQKEDTSKGIFDMELEDVEEKAEPDGKTVTEHAEVHGVLNGNPFAEKLDGVMVIMCEHLKACAYDNRLEKVFETLMECFQSTVLNAYKSKFAQFVVFYACSLDPKTCGLKFPTLLGDIFVLRTEDPISRMSAVAYLASYLARARFISTSFAAAMLKRLVSWCFEYCQIHNVREKAMNPKAHRLFYSGCQAVMYILCFRMRSMMDIPELKLQLSHMPLEPILFHHLSPLEVCLPSIVQEFLKQANAAHLFKTPKHFLCGDLGESEFSKAFGGVDRLDMFFPFDPCLLKESDRSFIRPNYESWSMVKTTYSNHSEDDDEDDDLDAPEFADNVGTFEDYSDEDVNNEDDDLGYSLNNMSITPKPSSIHHLARMPARIRPSVSP